MNGGGGQCAVGGSSRVKFGDHLDLVVAQLIERRAIADFDHNAAAAYGVIRATLERQGAPIGSLIAAYASSLNVTLVTDNECEFARCARS